MTLVDTALWRAAQEDYVSALKIARLAWENGDQQPTNDAVIQAATATLLIHVQRLRDNNWKQDHPVQTGSGHDRTPTPPTTTVTVTPTGVIPPCPKCGGVMKVNADRKTEKSPHYICLQQNGVCGKPSEDGKKFFATGAWQK